MTNPILNMLNNSGSNSLPTSMNDPRMSNAINYVNSHGGNPQQAFYQLCNERGLNPMNIINQVMGGR